MKKFEKQILKVDTEGAEITISTYVQQVEIVNNVVIKAEAFLGRSFTDDEKLSFIRSGSNFIMNELRSSFQFPKASDEFNLQAAGINVDAILEDVRLIPTIKHIDTSMVEGRFVVTQKAKDEVIESATLYTKNERQNKAFDVAKRLVSAFEELEELGLVDKWSKAQIVNVTNVLDVPLGSTNISVRLYGIKDLQECN